MRYKRTVIAVLLCVFSTWSNAASWADADPLERFNRSSFWLSERLDKVLLRPVALAYQAVLPDAARAVVTNVYSNLDEVPSFISDVLQLKWGKAQDGVLRFAVNSTLGVFGIFDVASRLGLVHHNEDFGQSLGYWGVPSGPYLFIPLYGPSSIRDGVGLFVDSFLEPYPYMPMRYLRHSLRAVDAVQLRAAFIEYEKNILGDKYTFLRDYYLNHRERLVVDGSTSEPVEPDFGDDFDESLEDFE